MSSKRHQMGEECIALLVAGRREEAIALLKQGADPTVLLNGVAPVHYAVQQRDRELLRILAKADANFDQKNGENLTPLHLAGRVAPLAIMEELLVLGANPFMRGGENGERVRDMLSADSAVPTYIFTLLKDFEFIPRFDVKNLPSRKHISAPNKYGKSLLDHPAFWEHLATVNAILKSRGEEPFTKADIFSHVVHGHTLFEHAIRTRRHTPSVTVLRGLVEALSHQGERVTLSDVVGDYHCGEAVLDTIVKREAVPALFSIENWRGANTAELSEFYHALPPKAQEQVTNYQTLLARVRKQQVLHKAGVSA